MSGEVKYGAERKRCRTYACNTKELALPVAEEEGIAAGFLALVFLEPALDMVFFFRQRHGCVVT